MKIVFTGGGTGGHFYPIIAVAEAIHRLTAERRLLEPQLVYMSPDPFDQEALFQQNITFVKTPAGKVRRYFAVSNFFDIFRTFWGALWSFFKLLSDVPDVVFSKGGYASVPTVIAAHWLRIPIVIHESDSKPGRANLLGAKYADRIAITFESSIQYFPRKVRSKIALTGIPIREALAHPLPEGAAQELKLDPSVPTVLVIGGSLGSKRINDTLIEGLPQILEHANVIHQTGKNNFEETKSTAEVIIGNSAHKDRYHVFPYLSQDSMREAAGAASVVVSRAGATAITEIALWNKPAILIPIPESVSHDQRTNAYSYAHTGAAVVLEEQNLTPNILASEINRITSDPSLMQRMGELGRGFANPNAANLIAEELIRIGLSHLPQRPQA
ncbi:MAG TPA: UDP-N-acetylglucosamine--N-acetylmuramyl-(pentapeptide) pyrophosphoryl-undecaprenol N-acetylglucosamine transferase [Candidatus Paceibacterota bacterium]|nr:UDP-N-acetylglucosamine--N-acetylmuramyl-(pentapeptide) pyrophosphoryl-undecaprenol N-acetylglucosamine transferase [Candidatus Paceibacterota bacterium]